jgi:hypothetical protein
MHLAAVGTALARTIGCPVTIFDRNSVWRDNPDTDAKHRMGTLSWCSWARAQLVVATVLRYLIPALAVTAARGRSEPGVFAVLLFIAAFPCWSQWTLPVVRAVSADLRAPWWGLGPQD